METKSATPADATKVALYFSAASMRMVKTSSPLRNISMKETACYDVPPEMLARIITGPGNKLR